MTHRPLCKWAHKMVSLIVALSFLTPVSGATKPKLTRTEQTRATVFKMKTGGKARVVVKLNSGPTLKGYIAGRDERGFSLVTKKETRIIAYADVMSIEGKGLHPAVTAAIVAGATAGLFLGVM
jgi:hypothetical protein